MQVFFFFVVKQINITFAYVDIFFFVYITSRENCRYPGESRKTKVFKRKIRIKTQQTEFNTYKTYKLI